MRFSRMGKASGVVAVAAAGLIIAAGPASADTALVGVDINSAGAYTIVSTCHIVAGVTTDARFITYVIHAEATAAGPSVPLATGVQCTVYGNGVARGGAGGSLPGANAEAVGLATVPVGVIPTVCVSGGATFLDGTTVPSKPCS